MKKIYLFLMAITMVSMVFAQKPAVDAKATSGGAKPEIDAIVEDFWGDFDATPVEKLYTGTTPTVTPAFKLAWDNDNLYMLLTIEDDDHYPSWESGGNSWEFDKVEVYFDVNDVLNDDPAAGPSTANSGHFQVAPAYADGAYGTPATDATALYTYCYDLDGEGAIWEYQFPWGMFKNKDGIVMDAATVKALPEKMGFDITVVDNDEATPARMRMVWANDGTNGEGWVNMNDCGTAALVGDPGVGVKSFASAMNVYPNPVIDQLTIGAKFNKVVISNLIGQQVKAIETSNKTINVSDLSKGVYVVKAYNKTALVGTARFTKN